MPGAGTAPLSCALVIYAAPMGDGRRSPRFPMPSSASSNQRLSRC